MKDRMLIGLDYDGTVVSHSFPEAGEFQPHAVRVLKRITDAGHHLILFTCREDETRRAYLTEAVNKLKSENIPLRSVNQNLPEDDFRECGGRKPYWHVLIDDRNFGGFPGWLAVEKWFEERGLLGA